MKFSSFCFALALFAVAVNCLEIRNDGRQLQKVKCSTPSMKEIDVANGWPILTLEGTGYNLYFCNNGVLLDNHVEAFADVRSPDGVWVGKHSYPESGVSLGQPTWFLTNTITGENRTIYGENKPQVRTPAPDGNDVDYTRRELYSDTTNGKMSSPRAWWVLRTNTTSSPAPKTNKCDGDIDVHTNFTAVYTFISCDFRRKTIAPAPAPEAILPIVLQPVPAPLVAEPVVAPTPVPSILPPAPAPAPVAEAPAPVALPPVAVLPTIILSMPPPAPSSAMSSATTLAAFVVVFVAMLF